MLLTRYTSFFASQKNDSGVWKPASWSESEAAGLVGSEGGGGVAAADESEAAGAADAAGGVVSAGAEADGIGGAATGGSDPPQATRAPNDATREATESGEARRVVFFMAGASIPQPVLPLRPVD